MSQVRSPRQRPWMMGVVSAITLVGGLAIAPLAAAYAPYRTCTTDLVGLDLDPTTAAAACAGAIYPDEVGDCVRIIASDTTLTPADALSACRRVQRPEEMADCVVDIVADVPAAAPLAVLDHCRRSLLPERYEECVTEIESVVAFAPDDLLTVCISASDRPRVLAPSFVPRLNVNSSTEIQVQPFVLPDRSYPAQP